MPTEKGNLSVSMVFPVYNEEAQIVDVVEAAKEALDTIVDDWEIILVDDASTDTTGSLVEELSGKYERVKAYHNEENLKLGGTLRRGFSYATKDLILYSDADFPFDMWEIRKAYRIIQRTDIVSAFRFDRTCEGFRRMFLSFGYNFFVNILFRIRIRDVNFAFKMFRRKILDVVNLKSDGSFIDVEFLAKSWRYGFRILQFGTDYFPRLTGMSTLADFRVTLKILKEMLKQWREIIGIRKLSEEERANILGL